MLVCNNYFHIKSRTQSDGECLDVRDRAFRDVQSHNLYSGDGQAM